ncbi:DUF3578 domain-containing protein [Streptomyces sp. SL13]|uniref:DUF3578 domain-containing protein n=1 Tax=Streptantibioticus silvisoli TaxID=2705255 RepID=A0AA90K9L5_9ACTN|nr:DUF3578 domain-containing protein [Streptantibioticus silvisoli]MDI5971323.1 DUF3578 domain-containing protein [Streptantibioticus silvisoli]
MGIRDVLSGVGSHYDRKLGTERGVRAQDLLREAPNELVSCVPSGLEIKASGGQGSATFTPWIGFYDPRETVSSQEGIYVVYIFAEDMRSVSLILNQGVSMLKRKHGIEGAIAILESTAQGIVHALPDDLVRRWRVDVDLKSSKSWRQRAYVAGSILVRDYELEDLPSEAELRADLREMVDVYRIAIDIKNRVPGDRGAEAVDRNAANYIANKVVGVRRFEEFKPKDSEAYRVFLKGRALSKGRNHERLVNDFAAHVQRGGFHPATVGASPRDLVVYRDEIEWLVEAKYVAEGNHREAVRQAIGQLLEYRFCLYGKGFYPCLIALFSEDVGDLFRQLLESVEICVIWRQGEEWSGSDRAKEWGFVSR